MTIMTIDSDPTPALTTKRRREAQIAADLAFVALMNRAIKRGKERATPGTHVETTPSIYARRMQGDAPASAYGSPAAMCADHHVPNRR